MPDEKANGGLEIGLTAFCVGLGNRLRDLLSPAFRFSLSDALPFWHKRKHLEHWKAALDTAREINPAGTRAAPGAKECHVWIPNGDQIQYGIVSRPGTRSLAATNNSSCRPLRRVPVAIADLLGINFWIPIS